jgi:hypothetical protein
MSSSFPQSQNLTAESNLSIAVSRQEKLTEMHSYRGNRALALQATSWSYEDDKFLNNGSILSDHNPISSTFSWSRSEQFRTSDLFGGPHG